MKFRIKNLKINLILISVSFLISALVFYSFYSLEKEQMAANSSMEKFSALNDLNTIINEIESEIKSAISYTDFFTLIISQNPQISEKNLELFASLAMESNRNIKSIQFAPNGVVKIAYPLAGNEAAIGHDLLADPARAKYAREAMEKRVSVLQGPVLARQGGYLIFNRKAVFHKENDNEKFWGFAITSMDFEKILKSITNKLDRKKYFLAVRTKDEDNVENLFGDQSVFSKTSVVSAINFHEKSWEFALYPKDGWPDECCVLKELNNFFYFIVFAIFLLSYFVFKNYFQNLDRSKKDPLTNTLNKNAIKIMVNRKLISTGKKFLFVVIDINGFKEINDNLGHYMGDCVLIELARRFGSVLRDKDYLSRFGGDEYIVCIENRNDSISPLSLIERLKEKAQKPMLIDDHVFNMSISIGYANFPEEASSYDELYKMADQKMYEYKRKNSQNISTFKNLNSRVLNGDIEENRL